MDKTVLGTVLEETGLAELVVPHGVAAIRKALEPTTSFDDGPEVRSVMDVEGPALPRWQIDFEDPDPVVLKPERCSQVMVARGQEKLVGEGRRIEPPRLDDVTSWGRAGAAFDRSSGL